MINKNKYVNKQLYWKYSSICRIKITQINQQHEGWLA